MNPVERDELILASASPRRATLLAEAGVRFRVEPCAFREPSPKPDGVSPRAWAQVLAYFKARAVAERFPERWVLGADTVVLCAGELLGKAVDLEQARRMLRLQAGRACEVITGVSLVRTTQTVRRIMGHELTRVWMRDAPEEIETYLRSGDWRGKAGAYGIQDVGDRLVERIEGSFSNVVGLPIEWVLRRLGELGLGPGAAARIPARRSASRKEDGNSGVAD